MRERILVWVGAVGGFIAAALGGWDAALRTLVVFMGVDYVTGLIVAGVFKKSQKSESGALDSRIGFKGILKKCMMLLMVLIGYQLDNIIGWDFVRYAVIIAFIVNELISIIENAELMGVPMHKLTFLQKAIAILGEKGDVEIDGSNANNAETESK